jgi:hypothetical protein
VRPHQFQAAAFLARPDEGDKGYRRLGVSLPLEWPLARGIGPRKINEHQLKATSAAALQRGRDAAGREAGEARHARKGRFEASAQNLIGRDDQDGSRRPGRCGFAARRKGQGVWHGKNLSLG